MAEYPILVFFVALIAALALGVIGDRLFLHYTGRLRMKRSRDDLQW